MGDTKTDEACSEGADSQECQTDAEHINSHRATKNTVIKGLCPEARINLRKDVMHFYTSKGVKGNITSKVLI